MRLTLDFSFYSTSHREKFLGDVDTCALCQSRSTISQVADVKGALESFDQPPPYLPSHSLHNLKTRKLRELALSLPKASSSTLQVPKSEAQDGLLTTLLIASCIGLASLPLLVAFGKRAVKLIFSLNPGLKTEKRRSCFRGTRRELSRRPRTARPRQVFCNYQCESW